MTVRSIRQRDRKTYKKKYHQNYNTVSPKVVLGIKTKVSTNIFAYRMDDVLSKKNFG